MTKKSVRLPTHVIPERYEIFIKPDLDGFTFDGEETITLKLTKPCNEITLHSAELKIYCGSAKITYNKKAETATLIFPKAISSGKHQLKLKFVGILNDKLRGFYRSKYTVDGLDKYLATTQFESTDARRAFPCFDEPAQKAIFDVTLMIPGGMSAISNTVESVVDEHESGYKIVKFAPTPKMSTYLLAFIIGDFEWVEKKSEHGVLVRVFTTPGKKIQAKFALDVASRCLDFFDDYFDIPYPLPSMDLIAIPDFAAGAMENWGAVTYRETALLIDPELSGASNRQRVAIVIAHELAHQWFGNLVTMEWWTHLWLNEGFASYMEYLAVDYLFPQWDIWTQFLADEQGKALKLDSLESTHPIEVEVGHPDEINEIFDVVSYSKGASILRMLAEFLGPIKFRNGLRKYLKKHSYGNAGTLDLWKALEKETGQPVLKIMKNWTGKPGYPLVSLENGKLTQSRFFSSAVTKRSSKDNTIWSIPLDGKLMDEKSMVIRKTGKLNLGEKSFIRIKYPRFEKPGNLSSLDRFGLIRDIFDLAEAGEVSTKLALEFALKYKDEKDYTVWLDLASHLGQISNLIYGQKFYPEFRKYTASIFAGIAEKSGWEERKGEKHTDTMLRSLSLYFYGSFGDKTTVKKAKQLFKEGNLRADIRGVVYNLIGESGGAVEHKTLIEMYRKTDNHQEKDRLGRALGLFQDPKLIAKTLDFYLCEDVRSQDAIYLLAAVLTNPAGRQVGWEFIKRNWQDLKKKYAGGHVFPRLIQYLGELNTEKELKDVVEFFKKNPTPEASRAINQAVEKIRSNIDWLARDRGKIANFFEMN